MSRTRIFLSKAKRNARITKSRERSGHRLGPVSKTARKKSTIARSLVTGKWTVSKARRKQKKTLLVLTERKSRREIIRPMRDQTARSVVRVLDSLEREYGANFSKIFRTITVDNGSEFADCAGMEKSPVAAKATGQRYTIVTPIRHMKEDQTKM